MTRIKPKYSENPGKGILNSIISKRGNFLFVGMKKKQTLTAIIRVRNYSVKVLGLRWYHNQSVQEHFIGRSIYFKLCRIVFKMLALAAMTLTNLTSTTRPI